MRKPKTLVIPQEIIASAKKVFFPNLESMPKNILESFVNWANGEGKDPKKDTDENRKAMFALAKLARMMWEF